MGRVLGLAPATGPTGLVHSPRRNPTPVVAPVALARMNSVSPDLISLWAAAARPVDAAIEAMGAGLRAVRPGDIRGWVAHGGYPAGMSAATVDRKPHKGLKVADPSPWGCRPRRSSRGGLWGRRPTRDQFGSCTPLNLVRWPPRRSARRAAPVAEPGARS